jgi:glycosyltransferase involved in cell wall biosynthesis
LEGKPGTGASDKLLDLAVVMPAYNECDCIVRVVRSWLSVLSAEGIDFRLIVINDGSTDDTASELEAFRDDPRVDVINKPNSGHGPTILVGYCEAVELAEWVFQCDSDDEIRPDHFPILWRSREQFDALFGIRSDRSQAPSRRLISYVSNLTVRIFFGEGVEDANTPYRLMRSSILREIISQIPSNTFAPNVIISGALAKSGVRILNHPVFWELRKTGTPSIIRWKLFKSVVLAFWQTLRCRPEVPDLSERPSLPEVH